MEQPKPHSNYQQQPIKPARGPYNAVNEGNRYISIMIINHYNVKYTHSNF